jgi:hypothetical protein
MTKAGLYTASATQPHLKAGEHWSTKSPMTKAELTTALRAVCGHPVDVSDAIYEVELCWNMT